MEERVFSITETAIRNMMSAYAEQRIIKERYEDEWDDYFYLEDISEYQYANAYCWAFESWLTNIGISPDSDFVVDAITREKEPYHYA